MAQRTDNVYLELYDQLKIPSRLEPENIQKMLESYADSARSSELPADSAGKSVRHETHTAIDLVENHSNQSLKMAGVPDFKDPDAAYGFGTRQRGDQSAKKIELHESPKNIVSPLGEDTKHEIEEENVEKTSNIHKTSAAFRSIASLAACAALALGVAGYVGVFDTNTQTNINQGGAQFAENYDDVHKTFEKYYVDSEENKTLDSAIADIEHSYNESENSQNSVVTQPAQNEESDPLAPGMSLDSNIPSNTEPSEPSLDTPKSSVELETPDVPMEPEETPQVEEIPTEEPGESDKESVDGKIPLPPTKIKTEDGDILFGDNFMAELKNGSLRIFNTSSGQISFTDTISPAYIPGLEKTMIGFYTFGNRLMAVYSNVGNYPTDASVTGVIDSLYGAQTGSRNSVEVNIYSIVDGRAIAENTVRQDGSLVDMNFTNGSLYIVTAYNDYRTAPIVGVDDLKSYVPGYSVNGTRFYVEPQNIMIPEYLTTTDYTVISGITASGAVTVQAVLGYEGRVILKDGAVYLFSYDSSRGNDVTSAKVFSLANGMVQFAGYKYLDGIALGGDGISLFDNSIAITSVSNTIDGYVTTLAVFDGTMNMISRADLPGALTMVKRSGNRLILSGAKESYCLDLSNPAVPVLVTDGAVMSDPADGLMKLSDGYVTLTKDENGAIVLSKIVKAEDNTLSLAYTTTICEDGRSKALDNNGLLFVNGSTVGVPYGFFDGFDYCFRYALYRAGADGFELLGEIEVHEADEVFENGKAVANGGYLYIFSEGRVYCASTADGLAVVSSANIVESAYSGHLQ